MDSLRRLLQISVRAEVTRLGLLTSSPTTFSRAEVTRPRFSANCVAAISVHRTPVAGILEIISRTAARNPPPADAASDNRARLPRNTARSRFPLSIWRGPDSPGCKNRFWRRPRVSVLPPAGRGRAPAAEICAVKAKVRDEFVKMTFHFFDRCHGAVRATSNECDRASGNTPGKRDFRGRQREAPAREIWNGMNRSASLFDGRTASMSNERRRHRDKIRDQGVEGDGGAM